MRRSILCCGVGSRASAAVLREWAVTRGHTVEWCADGAALESLVLSGRPLMVVVAGDPACPSSLAMMRRLKSDPFTAIAPITILTRTHDEAEIVAWYAAGADEVVTPLFGPTEQRARLDAVLARTERDVAVHPSTRLPGTTEIERQLRRRIEAGAPFAVCYADLDHFKEFNDRYSHHDGDRVIVLLAWILHDVVRGMLGSEGFVGHIGGDDFILVTPSEEHPRVCTEVLSVFDELVPLQYSEPDRRAGYFFGKDRRGQLHRVPLMTLSIGVVTSQYRSFVHPAEVSELATEMKAYAKSLPGSVYVVDRRRGHHVLRSGPGGTDARCA